MKTLYSILFTIITLSGCTKNMDVPNNPAAATATSPASPTKLTDTLTYLALGDSYTIGEAVPAEQSFPYQLAAQLKSQHSLTVSTPEIIATTGWTTDELIAAINQKGLTQQFDFVTLLIGVNNQYRHYDINVYRKEFVELLNTAIKYAKKDTAHVFVLSIPDYSVTPFAAGSNTGLIASQIDQYNAINREESLKANVNYLDITGISREAATNSSLIALDGLHPSATMYTLWVNQLTPMLAKRV